MPDHFEPWTRRPCQFTNTSGPGKTTTWFKVASNLNAIQNNMSRNQKIKIKIPNHKALSATLYTGEPATAQSAHGKPPEVRIVSSCPSSRVSQISTFVKKLTGSGLIWFSEALRVSWYQFVPELSSSTPCTSIPKFWNFYGGQKIKFLIPFNFVV